MERTSNCSTFALVAVLIVLFTFPVMSWCQDDVYETPAEPDSCIDEDVAWKRFDDIDNDSFVSLMGKRGAAQPNRHIDHISAGLFGRTTGERFQRPNPNLNNYVLSYFKEKINLV
uniref:Uncharacterized protein n=1 Tax=Sphaeramia orbicularis TaxID=375764 RepID=A0A673CTM0_9TELE